MVWGSRYLEVVARSVQHTNNVAFPRPAAQGRKPPLGHRRSRAQAEHVQQASAHDKATGNEAASSRARKHTRTPSATSPQEGAESHLGPSRCCPRGRVVQMFPADEGATQIWRCVGASSPKRGQSLLIPVTESHKQRAQPVVSYVGRRQASQAQNQLNKWPAARWVDRS